MACYSALQSLEPDLTPSEGRAAFANFRDLLQFERDKDWQAPDQHLQYSDAPPDTDPLVTSAKAYEHRVFNGATSLVRVHVRTRWPLSCFMLQVLLSVCATVVP